MKMSPFHIMLFALLALSGLAQERGPFIVAEYRTFTGAHEYEMYTMPEYQERHKIVRQEQHVLAQAIKDSVIQWADEGQTISFPRHFVKPELVRKGHYPQKSAALKVLAKKQNLDQQRADIRERNDAHVEANKKRRDPRGQRHTTKADSAQLYVQQREARAAAESMVRDRMDELMGMKNAHNLRGDEAFKGIRSK